jgi:hypothetical protein
MRLRESQRTFPLETLANVGGGTLEPLEQGARTGWGVRIEISKSNGLGARIKRRIRSHNVKYACRDGGGGDERGQFLHVGLLVASYEVGCNLSLGEACGIGRPGKSAELPNLGAHLTHFTPAYDVCV